MDQIRMAEHMLLEAKNHALVPYTRCDENDRRCALGLVAGRDEFLGAEKRYPWLYNEAVCPCECMMPRQGCPFLSTGYRLPVKSNTSAVIAHLFNEHVMQGGFGNPGAKPWTLERLADWIDSIDPTPRIAEPDHEQTCNRVGTRESLATTTNS